MRAIRLGLRFAPALAHGRPNALRLVLADTVAVRHGSVPEMPYAGEHHGNIPFIGGGDDRIVLQ